MQQKKGAEYVEECALLPQGKHRTSVEVLSVQIQGKLQVVYEERLKS